MRRALGVACALALAAPAWAKVYVNDPLTAQNAPGRGQRGGQFTANGWLTSAEPDALWWEIADPLPDGRIEYTVSGLSLQTSLTGADHDLLVLYNAPTGRAEPVPYSPWFRNNDFKVMTRVFGTKEAGRPGAMKLELAACPRGDPWHHDTPCPANCEKADIAYARGGQKDVGWDAAKAYRMVVEWGNGKLSFSRDGEVLGTVTYAGDYAPQPLRVRLGSPRHDGVYPGEAFMPKGLTFRDVLVSGNAGARTPVCGMPVMPADLGGVTDGATPATDGGAGSEVEVRVLQDVTGAAWEPGLFPDAKDLNVEGNAMQQPTAIVYLKFPPLPGGATRAILKLNTSAAPSAAGGSGRVCLVDDDGWSEAALTWGNRPPVSPRCAGAERGVDASSEVAWDITALLATPAAGNRNLAIVSRDANGAHYLAKEAGDLGKAPRLLVVVPAAPPAMDLGGAPSDLAVSPGDGPGASPRDFAPRPDAVPGAPSGAVDVRSGCGCRVGGRPGGAPLAGFALAGLALLAGRRPLRRQRRSNVVGGDHRSAR